MPSLSIVGYAASHVCTITLSSVFNNANYMMAGLSRSSVSYGASSINYFVSVIAPYSNTQSYVTIESYSLFEGEIIYAWAQSSNGLYYPAGDAVVPALNNGSNPDPGGGTGGGSLPYAQRFSFTYSHASNGTPVFGSYKQAGSGFYLTATEWNTLMDTIETTYTGYKGASPFLSRFNSGDKLYATSWNDVWRALGRIQGSDSYYSSYFASSEDPVRASWLNAMMDTVNSLNGY